MEVTRDNIKDIENKIEEMKSNIASFQQKEKQELVRRYSFLIIEKIDNGEIKIGEILDDYFSFTIKYKLGENERAGDTLYPYLVEKDKDFFDNLSLRIVKSYD
jgi:hypothetical protein